MHCNIPRKQVIAPLPYAMAYSISKIQYYPYLHKICRVHFQISRDNDTYTLSLLRALFDSVGVPDGVLLALLWKLVQMKSVLELCELWPVVFTSMQTERVEAWVGGGDTSMCDHCL